MGPRDVVESIGQRTIPLGPVFSGRNHFARGCLPRKLLRGALGAERDFMAAILDYQPVLEPVLADQAGGQADAPRIADLRERDFESFH